MERIALVLGAIVVLAILALPGSSAYPEREFVLNSVAWSRLPAGEDGIGILELVVAYYGEGSLLDVEAKLSLGCGVAVPSDTVAIGSWDPGAAKVLTFLVNASGIRGECLATLYISYGGIARQRAFGYLVFRTRGCASLSFRVPFYGNPSITASVSPSTVVGDSVNVLTIALRNAGTGDALDLVATVSFAGAALLGVEQPLRIRVDELSPGEVASVNVSLIPFSPQVSISIEVDYVDDYGDERVERMTVVVPSATGTAVVVLAEPSKLRAGSSNEVSLEVRNLGDSPLSDAFLQLQVPQSSQIVVEPQFVELGDVEPGESKRCRIAVSVPSTAVGTQNIAYALTYRSEQGAKITIRDSFSVFVVEQAQLAIATVEVVPSKPRVGETVIVSLNLINLGSQALNKVNVTVESSRGLQPLRKTYYFLGQIQPQAPTSVPFSFRALESGKQVVEFEVACEDVYGVEWAIGKTIEIEILEPGSPASERGGGPYGSSLGLASRVGIVALAAAAISVAALYARKRRR